MKIGIFIALSLSFMSLILFGCQQRGNIYTEAEDNPSAELENNKYLAMDSNFINIGITKLKGVDNLIFDDKESLKAFQEVFSSASKEESIVNMNDPEYYVNLVYVKNTQRSLYLWIGEKGQRSTFMKTEDTHTIYTVSEEMTGKLSELVESHFK
ncbi:hypothetical protein [Cytobacillus purgationiresistens]|uniref:YhfM-like domain-containing protein n=1 Tax=Cytobacillus purgationiresistens TaxID=863449 RepID=A0ABU0ANH0_9BACI|nr:hypothetical protein [Cytobacillus purgationiresistens]MDQ0272404.1 hypothetical protein [Cytobacillus purgationiresistens]